MKKPREPHDPFAISAYPLDVLPEVRDARRADFETDEFGPIWVEWLGGFEAASRFVRSLYEPKEKRGGMRVYGAGEPYDVPAATGRDDAERDLAFATIIDVNEGRLNKHLMRALPRALDVAGRWHKRSEAIMQATHLGELEADGVATSEAVARVANSIFGTVSASGLYERRKLDLVREIASVRAEHLRYAPKPGIGVDAEKVRDGVRSGKIRRYPHAADSWFAKNGQDRVAQAIVDAIRGRAPGQKWDDLRWDVLNLVEGFDRRGLPLSEPAQNALDYALELVDSDGGARNGKALGEVIERRKFMEFVREVSRDEGTLISRTTETEWRDKPILAFALALTRR